MSSDILGLPPGEVFLAPHSKKWKEEFEKERAFLQTLLGETVLDIHHIGSTSTPGLYAKPVIDVLVVLHRFSDIEALHALLETSGYAYHEQGSNDLRTLFAKGAPESITHHIHFTEHQSLEWKKAFAFWNYLRTHPEAQASYNELKQKLAQKFPNEREKYSQGKASFIKDIIQKYTKENRPQ